MLAGDFAIRLRKVNPKLKVFAGSDDNKPAGVYYVTPQGQYEPICGVDKGWVHEFTKWDSHGRIIHSGWRRVLNILVSLRLIDRIASRKQFGPWDEHRSPVFSSEIDSIIREIQRHAHDVAWKKDDLVDVGRELEKRKPDQQKI